MRYLIESRYVLEPRDGVKVTRENQSFHVLTMIPGVSFLQIVIICRTAQFFMHYFVGANYFWLLVEGIYLHTLLITVVLSERRLLQTYIVIGWGKYRTISEFLIL